MNKALPNVIEELFSPSIPRQIGARLKDIINEQFIEDLADALIDLFDNEFKEHIVGGQFEVSEEDWNEIKSGKLRQLKSSKGSFPVESPFIVALKISPRGQKTGIVFYNVKKGIFRQILSIIALTIAIVTLAPAGVIPATVLILSIISKIKVLNDKFEIDVYHGLCEVSFDYLKNNPTQNSYYPRPAEIRAKCKENYANIHEVIGRLINLKKKGILKIEKYYNPSQKLDNDVGNRWGVDF